MNQEDFPGLYLAADDAAKKAQSNLILAYFLNSILLIAAAGLAIGDFSSTPAAICSAVLFLASLGLFIYGKFDDLQGRWYKCRALAESIKTATWRFMMLAEPFHDPQTGTEHFQALLAELLREGRPIGKYLGGDWSSKDELTAKMIEIRESSYDVKRDVYFNARIDNQRQWYAHKSRDNRRLSSRWFICLCILYTLAIVCLLIRIAKPELHFLPVDFLAVIASSAIGWTQLKRFDELASAYGLTAHEIGIIKSKFKAVSKQDELSKFVSDAENAFSREHTQWAARRDH